MFKINVNYVTGFKVTLVDDGGFNREYDVSFIDKCTQEVLYLTKLRPGFWAKLTRAYVSDIDVVFQYKQQKVSKINSLVNERGESRFNKARVYIHVSSTSLGDVIAWLPYCLEFKEIHRCHVIVSTFKNDLFKAVYPELEFVEPGTEVAGIYAQYDVGAHWNPDFEPYHPGIIPMQKIASSILGLKHQEIEPRIDFTPGPRPYVERYICISTRSTAQCKHWDYWQELVIELKKLGYRVIETSMDAEEYGAELPEDLSLKNIMNVLYHADLFIGLSSGLSWLNWAIKKHTVMISNFTESFYEFQSRCTRITKTSVCHGCWNDPGHEFDRGYFWCPRHGYTEREFECHRAITVQEVLTAVMGCLPSVPVDSVALS